MPTFTKNLGLTKPDENDFYNQQTEQCENWDKLDEWSEEVDKKTVGATSSVPGIVKYGTDSSTALEGHRMAQSLGVGKFGGDVQTAGTKKVGYAYWCTVNKDMYICKVENSLNYIDAAYFEAFSNNALLGKLNNLEKQEAITITPNSIFSISSTSIRAVKIGRIVYLYIHDISIKTGDISKNTAIFTAPQGFKPIETVEATTSNHIHLANIDRASIGSDGIFRIIGGGNGYIPIGQHSLFMVYPTN